ncbi:hypothetical protein D6745_03895 [Candidatus Woesearchaeota archaeon]|nr:MAG: hypothetical protein D6745_03895 [Candidatus Woesearchaeota archaeon]
MKILFLLSRDHEDIGVAEIEALAGKKAKKSGRLVVMQTRFKDFERLAYTKRIIRLLFSCKAERLMDKINSYDWSKVYERDYSLRKISSKDGFKEKDLADAVWKKLKNPKANLRNAKTRIEVIIENGKAYCGLLLHENKGFDERRAHLRPGFHPSSLHPKLARAMVNLTEAKKGRTIFDPFCGTGGLLIEAGLMGLRCVGYDVDENMIIKADKNMKHYNIKDYRLELRDSTKLARKMSYVVSDLPYGKNTKTKDIDNIYSGFFNRLRNLLGKRAVIGLPDFVASEKYVEGFKKKHEFSYRIHKSLSKKILVLERL